MQWEEVLVPMDEFTQGYLVFDLGDVALQHGATLRDAKAGVQDPP
ncbi:hypothetical protein [Mycolicibacterium litorale]|nr:hypothetical protein [Mycolicibacterium litorale]TDY05132.1 hypothetical protein BCL50_3917 [Mycolicibacterium litorale]